jgi:hypothetical protein
LPSLAFVANDIELWIQWLEDGEKLADQDRDLDHLFALYDRAVTDYLCSCPVCVANVAINIWIRCLEFVQKHAERLAGTLEVEPERLVDLYFKKAAVATQYHIPEVIFPLFY